jgi:hypothetical protein
VFVAEPAPAGAVCPLSLLCLFLPELLLGFAAGGGLEGFLKGVLLGEATPVMSRLAAAVSAEAVLVGCMSSSSFL